MYVQVPSRASGLSTPRTPLATRNGTSSHMISRPRRTPRFRRSVCCSVAASRVPCLSASWPSATLSTLSGSTVGSSGEKRAACERFLVALRGQPHLHVQPLTVLPVEVLEACRPHSPSRTAAEEGLRWLQPYREDRQRLQLHQSVRGLSRRARVPSARGSTPLIASVRSTEACGAY